MKPLIRSQKGSTLAIVLIIIVIMSTLGVALLGLSFSQYNMSIFYRDKDKAYYAAEAAIEYTAKILDQKVAEAQEQARLSADAQIQLLLDPPESSPLRNDDGSINVSAVDIMYKTKYLDAFNSILENSLGFFINIGSMENLNYLIGTESTSQEASIFLDSGNLSKASLISAQFDPSNKIVTVIAQGNYYGKSNTGVKSQKISVNFSLLPDPTKIPYQVVPKTSVTRAEIPTILTKAVVSEKNLVSAGGTVNITGDVLCFGTVPTLNGAEDQNAPWYKYGGLIAGIPDTSNMDMDGNGMQFGTYFDFDTARTGTMINGSFKVLKNTAKEISGDIATMGYIHTLFSSFDSPSDIVVQGKAFSRSIKSEEHATYSNISLADAYTTDNLQIDSDQSLINIDGAYYGLVTASYDIDGSGSQDSISEDSYQYKRTSSVIVNGDSKVALNGTSQGGVYIGGSTFFRNFVDSAHYPDENRPYMTGVSALKSGSRLPYAYKLFNSLNGETRLYTDNGVYLTNPNFAVKAYTNITDTSNITNENMLNGVNGTFSLIERAKHFKWLWDGLWKQDDIYSRYVDTSAITVSVDDDQKINGYSFGDIVANGQVFGQVDFKGSVDSSNFGLMQKGTSTTKGWLQTFHDQLQPLLTEPYDSTKPKLDYVTNSKYIYEYIDSSVISNYSIPKTIYSNGMAQGVVYYKDGDSTISYNGSNWQIDGNTLNLQKGIIIATGNIYVQNGFSFSGVLLSSKNIVFSGSSNINYDKNIISNMLLDPNVAKLFKQIRFVTDSSSINGQRISQKNIKITDWTKVQ